MLKKIGEYLNIFLMCLCAIVLMTFGLLALYYILGLLFSLISLPWLFAGLIIGLAVGWSIPVYKNMYSDKYPEIADAFRWHIINYGEAITWGSSTLEFRTKESAEKFLADLIEIDNDYVGCYVTRDPCVTENTTVDATNLMPVYEEDGDKSYLKER